MIQYRGELVVSDCPNCRRPLPQRIDLLVKGDALIRATLIVLIQCQCGVRVPLPMQSSWSRTLEMMGEKT
jgi:hypothetical protein